MVQEARLIIFAEKTWMGHESWSLGCWILPDLHACLYIRDEWPAHRTIGDVHRRTLVTKFCMMHSERG